MEGRFRLLLPAFLAIAVLYAPQPLLPYFAQLYGVTETDAGLLIAVVSIPLSIAPLSFGVVLQRLPSARVLQAGLFALAALVAMQATHPSFEAFLAIRLGQGVAVAAILTALMTYIATFAHGATVPRMMAWYVAATILGGLAGRVLAGAAATLASWSFFSLGLSAALLMGGMVLLGLENASPAEATSKGDAGHRLHDVLVTARYVRVYVLIFCLFFCFSAFMNFLPFRLRAIRPGASELLTGLMYVGYVAGIGAALKAPALTRRLGGESRTASIGTAVVMGALVTASVDATWVLFVGVALICIGMFMVHSTAAGWINREGGPRGSLINGLYVSVYYAGGVLGAYLPGFVYEGAGWNAFLGFLAAILIGAEAAALGWWRAERPAR